MKLDKSIAVLAMVASLVLAAGTAAAQDNTPSEAEVDNQLILDEFEATTSSTADLDGGNVTEANLSAQQSTDQWAGVYGSADGSLVLGNGTNGALLYEWDASADYVFASNGSVEWTNVTDSNASNVDNYFGLTGSDTAVNTFTAPGTTSISLNGNSYEGDTALTYNSTDGDDDVQGATDGSWSTITLEDNSSATGEPDLPVFAGIVGEGEDAFNGEPADYQLLLPAEDGGNSATTQYNMYLELS